MLSAKKQRIATAYRAAQSLQASARLPEALAAYRAILRSDPGIAEAHFQIARILASQQRLTDARAAAEAALKLRPKEVAIWTLLAEIAQTESRPGGRAAVVARARKAGLSGEAVARIETGPSRSPARQAEPSLPRAAEPFMKRAAQAARAGELSAALKLYERAQAKAPGAAPILIRRAEALLTLGDVAASRAAAEAAIKVAPEVGGYWRAWSRAGKIGKDEPLVEELARRFEAATAGSDDRRQMGFALAKAMEDRQEYGQVFRYLDEANAITAGLYPYNHAADLKAAAEIRRCYSPALRDNCPGSDATDLAPIFVTGLPRSGTTLIEQILASHSAVTGAGEIGLITKPLAAIVSRLAQDETAAAADLAAAGQAYADEIRRRFPEAKRVSDKSIATYAHLGYVALALPRAKIVVVRRDPRDSCLSVLKTPFEGDQHRYSYSMQSTAAFYKLFAAQIAFWRQAAPAAFIEVTYEDVVQDLEGQARRLLEYCELPWEAGVLDFHKTERSVKTLSAAQVRQPLYSSSIGAWKKYEAELEPLITALGPLEDLL